MDKMNARNRIAFKLLFWIATVLLDKPRFLTEDQQKELGSIITSFNVDM